MTLPAWVGAAIPDASRRAAWREMIGALVESAEPGGPLEDFAFHGSGGRNLSGIEREGIMTSDVIVYRGDRETNSVPGTYWGAPLVAVYYAEDTAEGRDPPDWNFGIAAVRIADLAREGVLIADGQSQWGPAWPLGKDDDAINAEWHACRRKTWRNSLRILGAFCCLGPVGPDIVRVLRTADDVLALVAEVSPGRKP